MTKRETRVANTAKRNERIRQAFQQRFLHQLRPRVHPKEYVLAQLSEEFYLSAATVEGIIWAQVQP